MTHSNRVNASRLLIILLTGFAWVVSAQTPSGYLSSDQITGSPLNSSDRSVVVLIHGWTGKTQDQAPGDKYAEAEDADWFHMVQALHNRLNGTATRLLLFHWELDASTGTAFDGLTLGGFNNAASAASSAFLNGDRLATQLGQAAPDLRRVTLVAHSAGAWAAFRATSQLLAANPYVVLDVVLLDPFVPGVAPTLPTPLQTAAMASLAALSTADRIYRLENYFSIDMTDLDFPWGGGGSAATSQIFSWRSRDINQRVDYSLSPESDNVYGGPVAGHSGPKRFFTDTVIAATSGGAVSNGLAFAPWDFTTIGFFRSLPYEAFLLPSITAQPQGPMEPVAAGSTVTISVSANRADAFQWFKDGQPLAATAATLVLSPVNGNDAGSYVVRIGNAAGFTFSDKASLQVTTAGGGTGPVVLIAQPQDRSVTAGGSAGFNVTASGELPLSYQWQRDNSDIPGATNSTYTLLSVAVLDSGAQFRVRVTNEFGSVVSDAASLTVNAAGVITWTGIAGDGNWFNAANWNPMSVPTASDVVQANGGVLNVPASATFAILNFAGGSLGGTFTNAGTLNWTAGILNGDLTIASGGVLNISGAGDKRIAGGRTLNNAGTVTQQSGALIRFNSLYQARSTLNNLTGGIYVMDGDAGFARGGSEYYGDGGSGTVNNAGLFRKTGVNISAIDGSVAVTNAGTIEVQSGTLRFTGGGFVNSGTFYVPAGATLSLEGGPYSFGSGSTCFAATGAAINYSSGTFTFDSEAAFPGTGSHRVTGTVTFSGSTNLPNFEFAGGSLGGTFTNVGTLNWTAGILNGDLTIASGGVLNISGAGDKRIAGGRTLNNAGTVTQQSGALIRFNSLNQARSTLNNLTGGIYVMDGDAGFARGGSEYYGDGGSGTVNNAGLFRKTGVNISAIDGSVAVTNAGTIEVQSGTLTLGTGSLNQTSGETTLTGGTLGGSSLHIIGGVLSGSGVINASVINEGAVSPGSALGAITINGNFAQTAAGMLRMEMGGVALGSGLDRLVINGQATLAGTLDGELVGGFVPVLGDTFSLVTYSSHSGTFANVSPPALSDGLTWGVEYDPIEFKMVVNAVPVAPTATVSGGGAVCVGGTTPIYAVLTGTGPWTVTWSDAVVQTGVTTSPATRNVSPSSSATYTVTALADANCAAQAGDLTGSAVVTVNTRPAAPVIASPTQVGASSPNRIASAAAHAGSSYVWGATNGTVTAGQGTSQITFTSGVAGRLGLSVVETDLNGCASVAGTADVTVLDSWSSIQFYTASPCRVLDTRNPAGPLGGPALPAEQPRFFVVTGTCGVPTTARAVSVNVTVTQAVADGYLSLYPGDVPAPVATSISFRAGLTRANNAVIGLSSDGTGSLAVFNGSVGSAHVIVDVNGYFQ